MTPTRSRVLVASLWLVAVSIGFWSVIVTGHSVMQRSHGFVSHYTASRLVMEGVDGAQLYDDLWFREQVERFEPTVTDFYGANMPTTSLLLVPLAWMDYRPARAIWVAASFIGLAAAAVVIVLQLKLHGAWTPVFLGLTFWFQPVNENLTHGQMYVLVLVLLVVAWIGYRRWRPGTFGAAVGVLFMAKTAALMMWPLLLVERRWRALAWGGGVIFAGVLVSTVVLGAGGWTAYLDAARRLPGSAHLSVTAYQTQLSFFRHLLVYDAESNPNPLADLPLLGYGLPIVGLGVLLAISSWYAYRRGASDSVFAAFVLLGLIVSPVSLDYHYVIALLPIGILLSQFRGQLRSWPGFILITGTLLIAADLPYQSARLTPGAWAFFAYPKLYGALLLWGLALAGSRSAASAVVSEPTRSPVR